VVLFRLLWAVAPGGGEDGVKDVVGLHVAVDVAQLGEVVEGLEHLVQGVLGEEGTG
jgi:hypothetical protein